LKGLSAPAAFPLGRSVAISDLERDPYSVYSRLQAEEPITWIEALGMWYVLRYEDVRSIVMDVENFTTGGEHSLIFDTFGAHMLTTEGALHDRYRRSVQRAFNPGFIKKHFEAPVDRLAGDLVRELLPQGESELRTTFASRLPVQAILALFGMPVEDEPLMRRWYSSFEKALANFTWDEQVRAAARNSVAEFHDYLGDAIRNARSSADDSLLAELVNAPDSERLEDDEIKANLSIIFFGGISTVEALILNSMWALFAHPKVLDRARSEPGILPKVIEEAIRWRSPVQSATRHVVRDTTYKGICFAKGDAVNCMLGAANRDPAMFADPDRFDIERANAARHLGFATGPHACLGFQLAKMEGRLAVRQLLSQLPELHLVQEKTSAPQGYEFHQPRSMHVCWRI
jgi:cytochrome P450